MLDPAGGADGEVSEPRNEDTVEPPAGGCPAVEVWAIGTLAALLFLYTWNEFLLGLVMLADNSDARTAPVALSYFAGNRRNSGPG